MTCNIEISTEQYEELQTVEAVCIMEYERKDGTRFGIIDGFGNVDEMKALTEAIEYVIVFNGTPKMLGKVMRLVSELLPPY